MSDMMVLTCEVWLSGSGKVQYFEHLSENILIKEHCSDFGDTKGYAHAHFVTC